MAEYIEREAAIKRFTFAALDCLGMEPTIRAADVVAALKSIPAADVVPVVHGYWNDGNGPVLLDKDGCPTHGCYCSVCGDWLVASDEYPVKGNYCPNCGADMREVEQ